MYRCGHEQRDLDFRTTTIPSCSGPTTLQASRRHARKYVICFHAVSRSSTSLSIPSSSPRSSRLARGTGLYDCGLRDGLSQDQVGSRQKAGLLRNPIQPAEVLLVNAIEDVTTACWTILSSNAAIPNGRCRPSDFGMNTLLDGCARYAPR
jgi:hypothetical protein